MIKVLSIVFAFVWAFSLTACGNNESSTITLDENATIDKSLSANYIGVWESKNMRFTINKGGIGRYEQPNNERVGYFDFVYEVKDEVLVIIITGAVTEYKASFELSDDGSTLTIIQNGLPSSYTEETEFTKQATQ